MLLFVLSFLTGDLYLQTFSFLPSHFILLYIGVGCFLLYIILQRYFRYTYLLCAFALGFVWSAWYAASILEWVLPKEWEGKSVMMIGEVASLPSRDQWQTRFLFSVKNLQYEDKIINQPTLIKLSWREVNQAIHVGENWQLLVRLKRIHGTQNPGEFDFEAWSLQKGLRATGYVVKDSQNKLLFQHWYDHPIDQFRECLQQKIEAHLPKTEASIWLPALIMGERNNIPADAWQVLRNTGTNHLMAIAGLHIGIMAGFAHVITAWLWRRSKKLLHYLPAQEAGSCAALAMAVMYSALAGFSIPTQRACIMLAVFISALLLRRKIRAWHAWSFALLIVLLLNPLSVLTESFWLSFGTIALIIYGMSGRLAPTGIWWKWGRVQWVIGVGLIPLSLLLFQQGSIISFIANSIAIPWLGFAILPFCFLSAVFLFIFPSVGAFFLLIAGKSLAVLWIVLTWFSQLHFSTWYQVMPSYLVMAIALSGFLFLLFPVGLPGRWIGLLWLLPLFFYTPPKPLQNGEVWITLLDVGQGLSVVIQTKQHVLVYDTGPKLGAQFDMGESVVLPYLRTMGVKKLDMLVISHGDNDHIGGAESVLQTLPVTLIKTSVPEKMQTQYPIEHCLAGQSWQWDGVQFSFLYPTQNTLNLGNDSSCVLTIDNGKQRILLTGDIEKKAERALIEANAPLAADMLVAPHHGSKTSGIKAFVAAVHPKVVLYATGYRNRYHFPHKSVVAAYDAIHTQSFNTAETGALLFKFEQNNKAPLQPAIYRITYKRYWGDNGLEAG